MEYQVRLPVSDDLLFQLASSEVGRFFDRPDPALLARLRESARSA